MLISFTSELIQKTAVAMDNSTAPPEFSVFDLPPGSKGGEIVNFNIAFIVISTTLLFTRLYVRGFMVKALGLDDLLASIAYVRAPNVIYNFGNHLLRN